MKRSKRIFPTMIFLILSIILCLSLTSCKFILDKITGPSKYDTMMSNFCNDTCNGKFNAIEIDLGENNSAVYFIEENYGIWSNEEEKQLFDFFYIGEKQGGRKLLKFTVATQLSYYKSMVECKNGLGSCYYGPTVFEGICDFSDHGTVATISPDITHANEMFADPDYTVVMRKTSISEKDIIPFETALEEMHFTPDTYFDYVADCSGRKLSCELANLWVDGNTMIGEWNTDGSVIPIRMKFHEKVPYVEIFDIRESSEKLILKAYVTVADKSAIELTETEGEIFYEKPTVPVMITKTN